jgi:hypothetical protein
VWESNTRPQLDAGKKPVQEDVLGRSMGKLSTRLLDWYEDAQWELELTDFGDLKCDDLDPYFAEGDEDANAAQRPPSLDAFNQGFKVRAPRLSDY